MALDLAPPNKGEKLEPEFTPNPVLELPVTCNDLLISLYYFALRLGDLKAIIEPDVDRGRSPEINSSKHFVLKEAVKMKKSSSRWLGRLLQMKKSSSRWLERPSGSNEKMEDVMDDWSDVQSRSALLSSLLW